MHHRFILRLRFAFPLSLTDLPNFLWPLHSPWGWWLGMSIPVLIVNISCLWYRLKSKSLGLSQWIARAIVKCLIIEFVHTGVSYFNPYSLCIVFSHLLFWRFYWAKPWSIFALYRATGWMLILILTCSWEQPEKGRCHYKNTWIYAFSRVDLMFSSCVDCISAWWRSWWSWLVYLASIVNIHGSTFFWWVRNYFWNVFILQELDVLYVKVGGVCICIGHLLKYPFFLSGTY